VRRPFPLTKMVTSAVVTLSLAVTGLALPATAGAANAYRQILRTYERDATVPPCQYTPTQLQSALNGVDTYGAQYFADFTEAIQTALTSRAAGECAPAPAPAPSPAAHGAASTPPAAASDQVARLPSVTAATSAGVPAPMIVLAGLAAGLVLLLAAGGARRAMTSRRQRP
jgi:hypothetical protein